MQDAHNAILNYDDYSSLFAVYDGHGGHEVAIYTAKKLPNFIKSRKDYRMGKIEEGLADAFVEFDKTLTDREIVRELRVIAGKEADTGERGPSMIRPLGGIGVFPASVGAFHLERPLKSCKLKFEGSFPVTSLTVHSVHTTQIS